MEAPKTEDFIADKLKNENVVENIKAVSDNNNNAIWKGVDVDDNSVKAEKELGNKDPHPKETDTSEIFGIGQEKLIMYAGAGLAVVVVIVGAVFVMRNSKKPKSRRTEDSSWEVENPVARKPTPVGRRQSFRSSLTNDKEKWVEDVRRDGPDAGKTYYSQPKTGRTSWTLPEGLSASAPPSPQARRNTQTAADVGVSAARPSGPPAPATKPKSPWIEVWDEQHQRNFYSHKDGITAVWEKPLDYYE